MLHELQLRHFVVEAKLAINRVAKVPFPRSPAACDPQARGLMMEPEGKLRNSIMKQRILDVFVLAEIVLKCTLTMNDFQDLMMQPEESDNRTGSLKAPSSDPESQLWPKYT
ncbi:hypothetical protein EVAR_59500_1 [Eumeta japonica]|uniref:Uncharacterized protein n=1 Tax=Eumeta variegata TaxID=151549 RepID=A0A4C1YJR1_EUMVA|nr:hypothetical protein EVAR_59500_1 [Eumeta japonica]